jgi:restriction endonuclease S subunit
LGKTNPLNENDLKDFIELQKTNANTENSWVFNVNNIDKSSWDLTPNNPNLLDEADKRTPDQILDGIKKLDLAISTTEANIKNAEALFQSYLTEVLGRSDIGWLNRELITICEIFADGDWIESKDQSDSGIRLIQTGNIGFGKFKNRDSKARYISEETFKRLRCTEIKEGDILVSRLPDPVGRACIIPELTEKSITAVDCTIIRTKQEIINPRFLNYFFQSPQYFERVKKNITGATRQRISRSLLGKILVPIAPLLIQQNIVEKLDAISEEIDKAQTLFNQKNSEFILLKQSTLKQAFSGELVQDLR